MANSSQQWVLLVLDLCSLVDIVSTRVRSPVTRKVYVVDDSHRVESRPLFLLPLWVTVGFRRIRVFTAEGSFQEETGEMNWPMPNMCMLVIVITVFPSLTSRAVYYVLWQRGGTWDVSLSAWTSSG